MTDLIDSAVVILLDGEDSVLLLQRSDKGSDTTLHGKWGFPGGRIDEIDGTPYDAAMRELYEETGITLPASGGDVDLDKAVVGEFPPYKVYAFIAHTPGYAADDPSIEAPRVRLNPDEHIDYDWVSPAEVLRSGLPLAGPGTKALLEMLVEVHASHEDHASPQSPQEEGELNISIGIDPVRGLVYVNFGTDVQVLGLPPKEAIRLGEWLIERANMLQQ